MEQVLKEFIENSLKDQFGESFKIIASKSLGGGCINHASKMSTSEGSFFLKWNAQGPDDMFLREAESLQALSEANSELQIPEVYLQTEPHDNLPALLITQYLEPSTRPASELDEILGRGIAQIHQYQNENYGFMHDNYCGATPQQNQWQQDWLVFFRDQRIASLLNMIEKSRGLSKEEKNVYEQLLVRMESLLAHQPKASLNHGDLWSGNYMYSAEGPALIDPASYFADREFDLALMGMFGGFSSRVWSAYEEAYPLAEDWKERHELYMLYHYLNHYHLFGGSYGSQALSIASSYL